MVVCLGFIVDDVVLVLDDLRPVPDDDSWTRRVPNDDDARSVLEVEIDCSPTLTVVSGQDTRIIDLGFCPPYRGQEIRRLETCGRL